MRRQVVRVRREAADDIIYDVNVQLEARNAQCSELSVLLLVFESCAYRACRTSGPGGICRAGTARVMRCLPCLTTSTIVLVHPTTRPPPAPSTHSRQSTTLDDTNIQPPLPQRLRAEVSGDNQALGAARCGHPAGHSPGSFEVQMVGYVMRMHVRCARCPGRVRWATLLTRDANRRPRNTLHGRPSQPTPQRAIY